MAESSVKGKKDDCKAPLHCCWSKYWQGIQGKEIGLVLKEYFE
jgi:hypothetical protein